MPTFKVWSADRQTRRSLVAKSVDELKEKGCSKLDLNVAFSECHIVDESDGTLVDDDEVLLDMKDSVFLLLRPTEKWMPVPDKTECSSAGAQQANLHFTLANTSNSQERNPRSSTPRQEQLPMRTLDSPLDHDLSLSDVASSAPLVSTLPLPNFPTVDRITAGQCVFCGKADPELTTLVCGDMSCSKCLQECERRSGSGNNVLCPLCTNPVEGNGHAGTFSSNPAMDSLVDDNGVESSMHSTCVGGACNRMATISTLNDSSAVVSRQVFPSWRVSADLQQLLMAVIPPHVIASGTEQLTRQLINTFSDYTGSRVQPLPELCPKLTVTGESVTLPLHYAGDDRQPRSSNCSSTRKTVALISLMGSQPCKPICQADYYRICKIMSRPEVASSSRSGFVGKVLPYLMQRVKMRGCHVLKPSNIAELLVRNAIDSNMFRSTNRASETADRPPIASATHDDELYQPISRLDLITCLLNCCDDIVTRDLLMIMSQFPMALPLIMRQWEESRYLVMTSMLSGIVVKWEKTSGTIVEHSLFINPFRMIVAVRLGSNVVGKSTILNQLLTTEYMFSCNGEPGSQYGKPISLEGTAEFIRLTQETCKDAFWKSVLRPYYNEVDNEIALLVNVHGCAMDNLDILSLLKEFSCAFLVFIMPDGSGYEYDRFLDETGSSAEDVSTIYVDPGDYNPYNANAIQTSRLSADMTTEKVREAVRRAFSKCRPHSHDNTSLSYTDRLTGASQMSTRESQKMIDSVKRNTCRGTKRIMQFQADQAKQRNMGHSLKGRFIELFSDVLLLSLSDLQLSVVHLEVELSRLSNAESQKSRQELCIRKNELQQAMADRRVNNFGIAELQKSITDALDELDSTNLGLEHFVRGIAEVYQFAGSQRTKDDNISKLPKKVAELFVNGHPIELLNGDDGEIPTTWFTAVCKHVTRMYPNLRVFVVSILGLQSSGKSTLLNSLFACRFAVSVGRCTRGLFMRLLFLDEELAKTHNYDAILLIDTEGLGSPEKMNVAAADKKDRLLATFAMGISNLTIINVLGEYMKELVEILQIAIVTMTRLEKADISPDILMVQHLLTEKNTNRTLEGQGQFCEAIRSAIDLSEKQDVQCGVRDAKCLAVLFERIHKDTLLFQFHPFKDGATVNSPPSEAYHADAVELYQKILDSGLSSKNIMPFTKWYQLVESYWGFVKEEDFTLCFKNVKEIYEFIERGDRISTVKQAINAAFASHVKSLSLKLMTRVKEANANNTKREDILKDIEQQMNKIPSACGCAVCDNALQAQQALYKEVEHQPYQLDTQATIENSIKQMIRTTTNQMAQKLHALVVQQDCSDEFEPFIINHLKKELKNCHVGKFEARRRQEITNDIFDQLRAIAKSRSNDIPLRQRIIDELRAEYKSCPNMVTEFNKQQLPLRDIIMVDEGLKQKLLGRIRKAFHLDSEQLHRIQLLELSLNDIPNKILHHQGADCYQEGMVSQMYREVTRELEEFCKRSGKMSPDVKFRVHVWAQQSFCIKMEEVQAEWDRNNKPLFILEAQKQRYKQIINTRLQFGFTCCAEGQILGKDLISAIQNEAIKAENEWRSNHVKGLIWATNSEKVRLKFLEELALEVVNGKTERAVTFFKSPRKEIEKWYKTTVDGLKFQTSNVASRKMFDKEFDSVTRMIKQSENIHDLMSKSTDYLNQRGIIFLTSIDLTKTRGDDFTVLMSTIIETLDANKQKTIDSKLYRLPSDDPEVMSLLGCTYSCYWCGAICWGQRGHEENADDTKKHFSSHQPRGLIGTHSRYSKELVARPCCDTTDDTKVHFGEFEDCGISWKKAKAEHFTDWKFDRYHNIKFDQLMRWFFTTLNKDLAADRSLIAASVEDLKKYNCWQLDINDILNRIHEEVT